MLVHPVRFLETSAKQLFRSSKRLQLEAEEREWRPGVLLRSQRSRAEDRPPGNHRPHALKEPRSRSFAAWLAL